MRKLLFLLPLLLVVSSNAQASHSVALTWTASVDSTTATPGTVNVYKATGSCPASGVGSLSYAKIGTNQTPAGTFTDTSVTVGTTYCYYVTALIGGVESLPSNTFQGAIPGPVAPALKGVVQ